MTLRFPLRRSGQHRLPDARGPAGVVITCARPFGDRTTAISWLRDELAPIAKLPGVSRIVLSPLEQLGPWIRPGDVLIEFELARKEDARELLGSPEFRGVVAELRALRLRPEVAIASDDFRIEDCPLARLPAPASPLRRGRFRPALRKRSRHATTGQRS